MNKLKKILFNKGSTAAYAIITAIFTVVPEDCFLLWKLNDKWQDTTNALINRLIVCVVIFVIVNIIYSIYRKNIHLACGDNDRAPYGKQLLKTTSQKMTAEFGKGFDESNLRKMHQFYRVFPNSEIIRPELSWTHYRSLMRVEDDKAREFYLDEAVKSAWSTRQLDRQINTMFYQRLLSSRDKESVAEEIEKSAPKPEYTKILHDPYVLEFLELEDKENENETHCVLNSKTRRAAS